MITLLRCLTCAIVLTFTTLGPACADTGESEPLEEAYPRPDAPYSMQEIIDAGHNVFDKTTGDLVGAVESVFKRSGPPGAYIIGEEGAGAFIGGLRYGEGLLYSKGNVPYKVYWQGPSIGFDFGGSGSRAMILIYGMTFPDQLYARFMGAQGSAYLVGGLGVSFYQNDQLKIAPIRTGLGARIGVAIGYLKFTPEPTWNPF